MKQPKRRPEPNKLHLVAARVWKMPFILGALILVIGGMLNGFNHPTMSTDLIALGFAIFAIGVVLGFLSLKAEPEPILHTKAKVPGAEKWVR